MSWPGCPLSRKARATPVHLDSWTKDPTGLQNWPCPARADGAHRFLAIGWVCSSHRRTFSADSSCARACLQPTARPFTEKSGSEVMTRVVNVVFQYNRTRRETQWQSCHLLLQYQFQFQFVYSQPIPRDPGKSEKDWFLRGSCPPWTTVFDS